MMLKLGKLAVILPLPSELHQLTIQFLATNGITSWAKKWLPIRKESLYGTARNISSDFYYAIGGYISVQSRAARWGSNAIGTISELLQQELPGLRGFSETSIKRMRIFYEAWCSMFENRPLSADDLQNSIIPVGDKGHIEIRPLTTDELPPRYTS